MSGMALSHESVVDLVTADIGGTHVASPWRSMAEFERLSAQVTLDAWAAPDTLTTCKLEQAKNANGDQAKDLTTSGAGLGYDTDSALNSQGDTCVLEARAGQLDAAHGFTHVRLYAACTGNTGVDHVIGMVIYYGGRYQSRPATSAAAHYVTP